MFASSRGRPGDGRLQRSGGGLQVCGAAQQLQGAFFRDAQTWIRTRALKDMEQTEELAGLARKYLDLWLEHWSASLASPEAAAMMAAVMSSLAEASGITRAGFDAGHDQADAGRDPGQEPQALRVAHDAGGGRADELEKRVADLERRLDDIETRAAAGLAGPAGKPRARKPGGRTRAV
jgi:hypothetical protein